MIAERYMGCDWRVVAMFFVPGEVKAQPRPKFRIRWSKQKEKTFGQAYNPDTADAWKAELARRAKEYRPAQKIEGPVRVWWDCYIQRPKYMEGRKWDAAPIEHTKKPDRDNLDKAILDTLTGLEFFHDDAQVCGGELRKYYTAKPSYGQFTQPGCWIMIEHKVSGDLQPPDHSSSNIQTERRKRTHGQETVREGPQAYEEGSGEEEAGREETRGEVSSTAVPE